MRLVTPLHTAPCPHILYSFLLHSSWGPAIHCNAGVPHLQNSSKVVCSEKNNDNRAWMVGGTRDSRASGSAKLHAHGDASCAAHDGTSCVAVLNA